ncbi:PP2C family protein-serine/threonine phosphatase [Falsiroseomonas sp.]|uniref:PP2C family protein-serine/threonine phosphatase n=1 Tax=Falsiroseomonas sp. TaxID=2870721 RepID=UPI00356A8043
MDDTERTSIRRPGTAAQPAEEPVLHVLQLENDTTSPPRRVLLGALPLRIGRVEGNDLVLPSPEVSRGHCSVVLQEGRAVVTDLGSTNGTLVDGQRIAQPTVLGEGARIVIGPFTLAYLRGPRRTLERAAEIERDLERAARYVQALLPRVVPEGPVRVDWRFVPSVAVGGDGFGYRTLADGRFAVWLLDVAGHGVGSALLAASVMTMLREGGPPGADPGDCAAVLGALDAAFEMDRHGGLFFTLWYGVYEPATRRLSHVAGGHHPAYLAVPGSPLRPVGTRNPPVGAGFPGRVAQVGTEVLPPRARLHLFSDGAFETMTPAGVQNALPDFLRALEAPPVPGLPEPERLLRIAQALAAGAPFDDDVSILTLDFP